MKYNNQFSNTAEYDKDENRHFIITTDNLFPAKRHETLDRRKQLRKTPFFIHCLLTESRINAPNVSYPPPEEGDEVRLK